MQSGGKKKKWEMNKSFGVWTILKQNKQNKI